MPFLSVVLMGMFLGGCAGQVASDSGTSRSPGLVARIPYDPAHRDIRVVSVDGRRIAASRADIELRPGRRTIEVIYTPPKTARSYPVPITFNAEAGHLYALSAKMLQGRDAGTGYWEGKYQAIVYDLTPVREVGRSPGPSAPADRD
jgi:hypothetical protein